MTEPKMRLIDEKAIPGRIKKKSAEWLKVFLTIPKGKAWAITEEEVGVKAVSIKSMVNRLKKIGELPSSYKAIQRTRKNGKVTIYVINSTEGTEETEEAGTAEKREIE